MRKSSIFCSVYKVVFHFPGNRFQQMHFGGVFCTDMKSDGSFVPVVPSKTIPVRGFQTCKAWLHSTVLFCSSYWLHTGSRDVFVIRTSKPVENLWKNGLFWSRYRFVTHSIDRKPRARGLARSAYSIKYGMGGNKFGADFWIAETQMEFNEIAWFFWPDLEFLFICQIL